MAVPTILRILVPFAWLALPFTSLKPIAYFPTVVVFILLSLYLQPLTTVVGLFVSVAYITFLYITRKKAEIKPFKVNVTGREDGEVVLFCHGWPDRAELWAKTIPALEDNYRCVTYTLPHHAGREASESMWGLNFDESVSRIAATLQEELKKCKKSKALVVAHDWGSMLATAFERRFPDLVKRLVLVDVFFPPTPTHKRKWTAVLMMGIVYQYYNALTFLLQAIPVIGAPLADYMNSTFLRTIAKEGVRYTTPPDAACNYYYFYYHLNFIQEKLGLEKTYDERHQIDRKDPLPLCPVLFCYAQDKAFMFHNKSMIAKLEERKDGSKAVAFGPTWAERKNTKKEDRVGHWVQCNAPDKFNAEVRDFLARAGEPT